jgi:hypothetical protein
MKKILSLPILFMLFAKVNAQVGKVGINTTTPQAMLHVKDSSVLFSGPASISSITAGNPPASGAGSRMMWYADKAAFRVGGDFNGSWDKDSIGIYSFASGRGAKAKGSYSTAMGNLTSASGFTSTAIGSFTSASGDYSIAMGRFTTASANTSTAMGNGTTASGNYSIAMGLQTSASGEYSTAMGYQTSALYWGATAMGYQTSAGFDGSTAMGYQTRAMGDYTTAMGYQTSAYDSSSTAMGTRTTASGPSSTAMGARTIASGPTSTAMGYQTSASDTGSIAMGIGTSSSGWSSTTMGHKTSASGSTSTAMGFNTSASGYTAISMGNSSSASGDNTTAMGYNTSAKGYASTVLGIYNDSILTSDQTAVTTTTPLFIVGNGVNNTNRSNALVVLKNGNIGINTNGSLPKAALHIKGVAPTFDAHIRLETAATDTAYGNILYDGNMKFRTFGTGDEYQWRNVANTTTMRLTDAGNLITGNLGVGTSSSTLTSKLQIAGSISKPIQTTISNVTLDADNYTTIITPTANAVVVTLPAANTCTGREYIIVNKDGNNFNTNIPYLDLANVSITTLPATTSITLQSDGTNWHRIR